MDIISLRRHEPLQKALAKHIARAFSHQLDRFDSRISRVRVVIEDLNGPKGGTDQRCRAELTLREGLRLTVTALGTTPREAVTKAARRARVCFVRARDRMRARRWRGGARTDDL